MDLSRILAPIELDAFDDHDMTDASMSSSPRSSNGGDSPRASAPHLRMGKWFPEEEQFALVLIECFILGAFADLATGTSLRSFLAEKLQCPPMRISKKFSGEGHHLNFAGVSIPKKLGQKRYLRQNVDALAAAKLASVDDLKASFLRAVAEEKQLDLAVKDKLPKRAMRSERGGLSFAANNRVGYWSREEQTYASKLIEAFMKGQLQLRKGTSLRSFLAHRLGCNPMRVSKKLATCAIAGMEIPRRIGTATYQPKMYQDASMAEILQTERELQSLRALCFGESIDVLQDKLLTSFPSRPLSSFSMLCAAAQTSGVVGH
ncbi:hypothetical protein SDRG_03835 [Saprolegnia diclina VS20]|uniref:Uncharacterized protein n=1 Tax=Saprolegnia diclina (strain VS20) TaxID=1156394 RepID=T0S7W7_SAPDV|nr:hypothetical protein SDRG_03835 [Saprolegnia diclina VS20]EQC38877.1 hypothetical protein SDRG_03835 [Saprolegnia diclina VS20]|eukprot:XP_008607701.1 hypothetical protein SDRG_03835 [Saprolegnia diclina VS20]